MTVQTRTQMRFTCDNDPTHQSTRNVRQGERQGVGVDLPEGWVGYRGPNNEELHFDTLVCAQTKMGQLVEERWAHFNPPANP